MKIRFTTIERITARLSLAFLLVLQSLAMASHANAGVEHHQAGATTMVICADGELREIAVEEKSERPTPFAPHCPDCIAAIAITLPAKADFHLPMIFPTAAIFSASNAASAIDTKRPDRINCLSPPLST